MIAFALGVLAGFVIVAIAAVIIMNWPEAEREAPPVVYHAIGAGRLHDTSQTFGAVPSDWNPVFRPNDFRK
jgi:hypothetical protein